MPTQPDDRVPLLAVLMIMGAVTCFSALDATAKMLVTGGSRLAPWLGTVAMSSIFVVWARFAGHVVLVGGGMGAAQGRPVLLVRSWPWQLTRSACLFGATLFNFLALRHLQLAETVAVFFLAPMVVTALAGPLLGEWAGWRRWTAIVAGFIGVLVMARPGTELFQPAIVLSLLSMLSYSLYVLLTRRLAGSETPESLLFVSALVPASFLTLALPFAWTSPASAAQWFLVASLGVFGLVGHMLFIRAYALASTGALAPYTYVQIPVMVLFGWLLFADLPDATTFLGIAIIAGAGLSIAAMERRRATERNQATEREGGTHGG